MVDEHLLRCEAAQPNNKPIKIEYQNAINQKYLCPITALYLLISVLLILLYFCLVK